MTPAKDRAPCTGDPRAVRLWGLNLSHPDTVDLKNPSACPIELSGLELFFDDRDDAFSPDSKIDCTIALPSLELPAGASVRVSEIPFAGEIDAIAGEISGCSYPLTFNPDRGGVTYLCDGPCRPDSVIDVLAHQGDDIDAIEPGVVLNRYRDPPELLFGALFSEPVRGASKHNDGFVRYQRIATEGRYPDFRVSDWGLQNRTLFADFEDGITVRNVASAPAPWGVVPGEPAAVTVSAVTARSGGASLRIEHLGNDGVSDALRQELDALSTPRDLAYFVHATPEGATAGELALFAQSTPAVELGFGPGGLGATYERGHRAETAAFADTWYRIELRDIDWDALRFDLYVDGILVRANLAIAKNARSVDEVRLFGTSGGSSAHFDAITFWGPAYAIDVSGDEATGANRCAAPSSPGSDGLDGPTCDDVDGPSTQAATCASFCADWAHICCGESFPGNYGNAGECLADCATFSAEKLCCRAGHGSIGGPERCRWALGAPTENLPTACGN
jgi:hypothetical protein